ncbi:hypothetical protein EGY75_24320, partial [Salmonella enterica]|nr:hypothetical protein [Salmonella enterica]
TEKTQSKLKLLQTLEVTVFPVLIFISIALVIFVVFSVSIIRSIKFILKEFKIEFANAMFPEDDISTVIELLLIFGQSTNSSNS